MKENKLIPLSEFVLEQSEIGIEVQGLTDQWQNRANRFKSIVNYTKFITQNLADRYTINGFDAHPLNRFLPTDKEGNVLDMPKYKMPACDTDFRWMESLKQYQEAKDRVLFEGFKIVKDDNARFLQYEDGTVIMYRNVDTGQWKAILSQTIEDLGNYFDLTLTPNAIKQLI